MAALAQVNPEPNAVRMRRSPRRSRPAASASSSAMGIEAAVVLPYRSMLAYTWSGRSPANFWTISMMRRFAWCGTRSVTSPGVSRSEEHTSELQSLAYLVCRLLLEKKKQPRQHMLHHASHPDRLARYLHRA